MNQYGTQKLSPIFLEQGLWKDLDQLKSSLFRKCRSSYSKLLKIFWHRPQPWWRTFSSTLAQGVCQIREAIFPDISLIFPWFNIGHEQIPCTTHISDKINTYHYASPFKQTLPYLSKEVCYNFIRKKENQHSVLKRIDHMKTFQF